MGESFQTVCETVVAVYLAMAAGFGARKIGWLKPEGDSSLMSAVVNLLMPCLIASKVLQNDVFTNNISNLYIPPVVGFLTIFFGIGISFLFARLLPARWTGLDTPVKIGTFAACTGMLNYGYVPIPLLADLFPNDSRILPILFVTNLGTELALWTVCVGAIRGRFDRSTIRSMFSIPTMSILICLLLNVTGIDQFIPHIVLKPVHILGPAAIPLSLIFVGATLGDRFGGEGERLSMRQTLRSGIWSSLIRLGVLPMLILWSVSMLPVSREFKIVMAVYAAMSSAVFPIVLTKLHKGDMPTALETIIINSTISLITTPVWILIGLKYFGIE